MEDQDTGTGYTLEKIHTTEQLYRLVNAEDLGEEREYEFGWDWRIGGESAFQVLFSLEIKGTRDINELVRVKIVGTFSVTGKEKTVDLPHFVQYAAPAILFAYVRQIVTTLTSQGPFEPLLIAPTNMQKAMDYGDFEQTTGYSQLADDPELAESWGVEL